MTKPTTTSRTCIACGIQKPLPAFLQITGAQGTVYGNVCSDCRSKTTKIKAAVTEEDEGSSSSGLRVDSKAKIHADNERKELKEKQKKDYKEQADQEEDFKAEKTERTDIKIKSEKDHRKNYIDSKHGFLGFQPKVPPTSQDPAARKNLQEKHFASENQKAAETQNLEKGREQENLLQNIDFGQLSVDSQAKYRSETFQRFKTWLGDSAPARTMERLAGAQQKGQKPAVSAAKETQKEKDPLGNYIDKNWKPGSGRRR